MYAILAVGAIAVFGISEILISVQKAQMKKQFLEELDRRDKEASEKQS